LDLKGSKGADKKKTQVIYCERYVRKLLAQWKFTPQKPTYVACEQGPEQVRKWIEQVYPALRRRARSHHGLIFWLDETGIRSQHASGRSYSPKGRTPVIPRTGQRFYCNVISAMTNGGRMHFTVLKSGFNSVAFVDFLKRLVRMVAKKVFLIGDNHPVHVARKVKLWLEQNKARIELHLLPPYAPELNVNEYFNQHLKSDGAGKSRPAGKDELMKIVSSFSRSVQRQPNRVRSFFLTPAVSFAKRYTKLGPQ
jgi:transposase